MFSVIKSATNTLITPLASIPTRKAGKYFLKSSSRRSDTLQDGGLGKHATPLCTIT